MLTRSPSSGIGGPLRGRLRTGVLSAISTRCNCPFSICSITPIGHLGYDLERSHLVLTRRGLTSACRQTRAAAAARRNSPPALVEESR